MRKSELSDKQLEDILRQMPKVKDHRDPRDIYQNIAIKLNKRKRRPVWIAPSLAMAAALFLFFFLTANTLNWKDSADSKSASDSDKMVMMDAESKDSAELERTQNSGQSAETGSEEGASIQSMEAMNTLSSVYDQDLLGQELLTYEIPDPNFSFTVPVSIVIPNTEGKSWLELYEETSPKLNEEEWGLKNYYPLNADFDRIQGEATIRVDIPADSEYCCKGGTASEVIFVKSLERMFKSKNVEKITLFTDGTPGINFSHYGFMKELQVVEDTNRAYYFFYPKNHQQPLLVPSQEQFDNLETAILKMTNGSGINSLETSIPEELKLDLNNIKTTDNKTVQIQLNDQSELHLGMLSSFEAILFAAKSFGFDYVKFENTSIDQLGPFNFNEKIPVPVSPNKKLILE